MSAPSPVCRLDGGPGQYVPTQQQRPIPNLCTSRMSRNHPERYTMRNANIVGLDDLKLEDITPSEAIAATRCLSHAARDRDEFRQFMDMVRPAPYVVALDPAARRALPRRSA